MNEERGNELKTGKSEFIHLRNYSLIKQLVPIYSVPSTGDKWGKARSLVWRDLG